MLVLVCKWTTCVMSEFELECQRQRKMIGRIQKKEQCHEEQRNKGVEVHS